LEDIVKNGGTIPVNLKPLVKVVREKTPAQAALEKEYQERNPVIIQELKDVRKQISDLEKQRDILQNELDDNKIALRSILTGDIEEDKLMKGS
jgi:FtsZ-binding cell division protein ZapB